MHTGGEVGTGVGSAEDEQLHSGGEVGTRIGGTGFEGALNVDNLFQALNGLSVGEPDAESDDEPVIVHMKCTCSACTKRKQSGITLPDPQKGGQRKETTPPTPQQPTRKRLWSKTTPPKLPATTEAKKKGKRNPKPRTPKEVKPKANRESTNSHNILPHTCDATPWSTACNTSIAKHSNFNPIQNHSSG